MERKGKIKKGEYYDSVSLMIVSRKINEIKGIIDSAVVMGTAENKAILKAAGLFLPEFENTTDTDLLIGIKAEGKSIINEAMNTIEKLFSDLKNSTDDTSDFLPRSLEGAIRQLPEANLSLISVAGKYAASEAKKALRNGLHVMIFSDNVPIEDEIDLKQFAKKKELLVMGPDCGTAIINNIPLAFANAVNKGNIGIVAASGTGLQEISSIISNAGAGISQAIGTGGRDISKQVGGIMFIEALKTLNEDEETKIIVLVSKPPHADVLQKISREIKQIEKPVIAMFIGGDEKLVKSSGAIAAATLEEAAIIAINLATGQDPEQSKAGLQFRNQKIDKLAQIEAKKKTVNQKYLRGLFSGGTLCDETQLILQKYIGDVYSNTPLNPEYKLKDSNQCFENTILDLGEDEFTVGRPHPMIDFSLRNEKIIEQAENKNVAVILLDVVLGFGANLAPSAELVPVIKKALKKSPELTLVCSVTGTEKDPQNKKKVKSELENAGAMVMDSNAAASEVAGKIIKNLK